MFSWNFEIPQGFHCRKHSHPCTELVFNREATGLLYQGEIAYPYQDRSVFVYQPEQSHWIENNSPGRQICLGLVGGRASELAPGVLSATSELCRRFEEIATTLEEAPPSRDARLDLLSGLVVCELLDSGAESRKNGTSATAQRIRDSIERSLTDHLSLDELAKRTYLSAEYLRKVFREEYDEPVTKYILRRRLELASQLLLSTREMIKDIAWQCGFPDEFYFSRAFKRMFGSSPTQFRDSEGVKKLSQSV